MTKVYDCFTFFNEIDLLEIRLAELSNVVDKFVIVESNKTFTDNAKELIFKKNEKKFSKYKDKIIYVKADTLPKNSTYTKHWSQAPRAFQNEHYQRDQILKGLTNAKEYDIIVISDVDEIPSISSIDKAKKLIKGKEIIEPKLDTYYYYLNNKCSYYLPTVKISSYKNVIELLPQGIRQNKNTLQIPRGGWHFSFLGGVNKIQEKISSFAHTEYNKTIFLDQDYIQNCLFLGIDIFIRPEYSFSLDESNLPKYIQNNKNKLSHLFYNPTVNSLDIVKKELIKLRQIVYVANNEKNKDAIINKLVLENQSLYSQLNTVKNTKLFKLHLFLQNIKSQLVRT